MAAGKQRGKELGTRTHPRPPPGTTSNQAPTPDSTVSHELIRGVQSPHDSVTFPKRHCEYGRVLRDIPDLNCNYQVLAAEDIRLYLETDYSRKTFRMRISGKWAEIENVEGLARAEQLQVPPGPLVPLNVLKRGQESPSACFSSEIQMVCHVRSLPVSTLPPADAGLGLQMWVTGQRRRDSQMSGSPALGKITSGCCVFTQPPDLTSGFCRPGKNLERRVCQTSRDHGEGVTEPALGHLDMGLATESTPGHFPHVAPRSSPGVCDDLELRTILLPRPSGHVPLSPLTVTNICGC